MLALAHVRLDIRYVILVVQTGNCSIESPCTAKLFPHHMYVVAKTVRCVVVKKTLRTERYRAPSFHGTQCTSLYLNARIAPRVLFLSKCYKNGPHAGFLLYMADVAADT